MAEYKLSYTAPDIDKRLGKVDEIDLLKTLVGNTPVSEQIADAIVEVYVQDEEPTDAHNGYIWIDTSVSGLPDAPEKKSANVYVVDSATTDMTLIDFSQFSIGDVIVVTI